MTSVEPRSDGTYQKFLTDYFLLEITMNKRTAFRFEFIWLVGQGICHVFRGTIPM